MLFYLSFNIYRLCLKTKTEPPVKLNAQKLPEQVYRRLRQNA